MSFKHILRAGFWTGIVAVIALCVWFDSALHRVHPLPDGTLVYIPSGSSVHKISNILHDGGIIDDPFVFKVGARLARAKGNLKAGEYLLPVTISSGEMIRILQMGKTHQRRITIPEGLMAVEIVALLNSTDGLEGEITNIPDEGSLLPETYHFSRGMKRTDLIDRMEKGMAVTLRDLWDKRGENLTVKTPEETVILASIVEKETGIAAERPRVAGVFANRLKIGMPLQTDPTVIYAITQGKERLNRPLYRKDLNIESPYNTYVVKGLPPGPIANPGHASLSAVLNPEAHDYLYFVADGTGGHAFAKSHEEHIRNVAKWRQFQRENK